MQLFHQTCQRLRDASLGRPIWLGLVQWYSSTIQPRPFIPEKPLELYTDRELEYLVLRWQSGKAGYLLKPKRRDFSISDRSLQGSHLLEGGRWLIFAALDGSVKYYDLHSQSESLDPVTLLPTHFNIDSVTINLLAVDLDPDAEYLTFNLASVTSLVNVKRGTNPPQEARWIEVNRVTPYWDENGNVKGLRADRLACFREEHSCFCDSFTLRGRCVAYSLQTFRPLPTFRDGETIVIVDWTSADPTSLIYPRRLIWRNRVKVSNWDSLATKLLGLMNPEWMALLPDDRLICHDLFDVKLFDLNDAVVRTANPIQDNQPPGQLPIASFRWFARKFSRPYIVDGTVRFSVVIHDSVKGLIIPCSRSATNIVDSVDLVSDTTFDPDSVVTYDRVVGTFNELRGLAVARYTWPDDLSSSLGIQKTDLPFSSHVLFDSSSGRIVVGKVSDYLTTFDFTAVESCSYL